MASAPAFSRSGVSVAEVDALAGSFVNAHRWLLPDGSMRFGVELSDGEFTTPSTPPTEGAIEILACGGEDHGDTRIPGEIVARASDGRLVAVKSVAAPDGELQYSVQVLKTYRIPTPCARDSAGRPCLAAAVGTPCAHDLPPPSLEEDDTGTLYALGAGDVAPARHLATLDDALQHIVRPLTLGKGASLADMLGRSTALAMRGSEPSQKRMKSSREARIFLSWSFRNRLDCFAAGFRAFLAEHPEFDPATCFAWVSMLCVDQSDEYQAQLDPVDWAEAFVEQLQSMQGPGGGAPPL